MDTDTIVIIGLIVFIIIMIGVVIIGSYHHVNKAKFKPIYKTLSDGSLQIEFSGFGGLQKERTKRFLDEYSVGMNIIYNDKEYIVEEIKEVAEGTITRADLKMVLYLKEVSD